MTRCRYSALPVSTKHVPSVFSFAFNPWLLCDHLMRVHSHIPQNHLSPGRLSIQRQYQFTIFNYTVSSSPCTAAHYFVIQYISNNEDILYFVIANLKCHFLGIRDAFELLLFSQACFLFPRDYGRSNLNSKWLDRVTNYQLSHNYNWDTPMSRQHAL